MPQNNMWFHHPRPDLHRSATYTGRSVRTSFNITWHMCYFTYIHLWCVTYIVAFVFVKYSKLQIAMCLYYERQIMSSIIRSLAVTFFIWTSFVIRSVPMVNRGNISVIYMHIFQYVWCKIHVGWWKLWCLGWSLDTDIRILILNSAYPVWCCHCESRIM